jgi:hypothetical protein
MRILATLTAAMIAAVLAASVALRDESGSVGPRILSVEVVNGRAVMERLPKFGESSPIYEVDGQSVRLLARAVGLNALDVHVSINSRTDFGQFPGRSVGGGIFAIDVRLPEVGSEWPSPGPGVSSPRQSVAVRAEQVFVLQIIGEGGVSGSNESFPVPGPSLLIKLAP